MKLGDLLEGFIGENIEIKGIQTNAQDVRPGDLFVALPSLTGKDIRPFIKQAISKGAQAIVCSPDIRREFDALPLNFISSDNPRKDLAQLAPKFYPSKPATLVAVTGTNGKSSVVEFTRQLWEKSKHKASTIGTIGIYGENGLRLSDESLTSPDTLRLHASLEDLATQHYTHVALEASSHGLDQYRVANLPLQAAAFTNLTQDHLDYHGDMEAYFQAKAKLFYEVLPEGATAVLNADTPQFTPLQSACAQRNLSVISYGKKGTDLKILSAEPEGNGLKVSLELMGSTETLHFPLIGDFQLMNALCALGLALSTGLSQDHLGPFLEALQPVPGRLQYVGATSQGGQVYVDYAHTPDALENVLKAVRPHTQKTLRVLFGCGGNRDTAKRPLMGKVACEYADAVMITDDNPRHEDPATIRQAILAACPHAQEEGDRGKALKIALNSLEEGDILVVAGKGHETGQIIGDVVLPFNDVDLIQTYLQEG